MIYLLAAPEDEAARELAAALQRRGEPCQWFAPQHLMSGATLSYRIDGSGSRSLLRLQDGRTLRADAAGLVLNRLDELPPLQAGSPADAAYLGEEWRAVLAAWLRTLRCPVLNPPRAASLAGPMLSAHVWRSLARAHGLPLAKEQEWSEPHRGTSLVWIIDRCLGPDDAASEWLRERIARLARHAGTPLLELTFDRRGEAWRFVSANPQPNMAAGAGRLLDALIARARHRS